MEASIKQFKAITGASEHEANLFLEISGGDVQLALELFLGGGSSTEISTSSSESPLPDWFTVVWSLQTAERLPEAWLTQRLEFAPLSVEAEPFQQLGLVQYKNGPCGVLAVLNALIIHNILHQKRSKPLSASVQVQPDNIAAAISQIIQISIIAQQDVTAETKIALWTSGVCPGDIVSEHVAGVSFHTVSRAAIKAFIFDNLNQFSGPAGILLIIYSCARIRTNNEAGLRKEIQLSGGEPPLITGPIVNPHRIAEIENYFILENYFDGRFNENFGSPDRHFSPLLVATSMGFEPKSISSCTSNLFAHILISSTAIANHKSVIESNASYDNTAVHNELDLSQYQNIVLLEEQLQELTHLLDLDDDMRKCLQ